MSGCQKLMKKTRMKNSHAVCLPAGVVHLMHVSVHGHVLVRTVPRLHQGNNIKLADFCMFLSWINTCENVY